MKDIKTIVISLKMEKSFENIQKPSSNELIERNLLDSKCVLLNHIKAKLRTLISISSTVDVLAAEICENRSDKDIIKLLEDETLLKSAILTLNTDGNTKQKLGEELFTCVSRLDTSLCAQVTGMLLDLDVLTICRLLNDSDALEGAVFKAKAEYLKFKQKSSKEFYGEELYPQVQAQHSEPGLASQLTGMLLELDISILQQLLEDPKEFNTRLEEAFIAYTNSKKH